MTGAVLRRGLVYAFWIGAVSTVVTLAGGPGFLHLLRLEEDLADGAARAMLVFALSLPGWVALMLYPAACSLTLLTLAYLTARRGDDRAQSGSMIRQQA